LVDCGESSFNKHDVFLKVI